MTHIDGDTWNNNSKGHNALKETHDMSVQSSPYKLGLWCTWNTLQLVHGRFQNLQGCNGLNHYPRPVTVVAQHLSDPKWDISYFTQHVASKAQVWHFDFPYNVHTCLPLGLNGYLCTRWLAQGKGGQGRMSESTSSFTTSVQVRSWWQLKFWIHKWTFPALCWDSWVTMKARL